MRKVITSALIFVLGLILLDRGAGMLLRSVLDEVDTGQAVGLANRALANADRDLLVFGSSRARRHIDPAVLAEELGVTAYNAGCLGQGITYARMLEALILTRDTSARLFVLEIDPVELYRDQSSRASLFAVFFGESDVVDEILETTSWSARLKLASHAYRYNSLAIPILRNRLAPQPEPLLGFAPVRGELSPLALRVAAKTRPSPVRKGAPLEPLARTEDLLAGFLSDARGHGIATLMVVGPRFRAGTPIASWELAGYERIAALAAAHGASFAPLDGRRDAELTHPSLFRDLGHLNAEGAEIFSHRVADEIRKLGLLGDS